MKIDHIGYAVKNIDRAKKSFEELGFHFENAVDDQDRNVKIVFAEKDGFRVELVQPLSEEKPSPVDTYLANIGPTPYHFCFSSNDLEKDIAVLGERGFKMLIDPQPAVAFNGCKVAFMMNFSIGLVELLEEGPDNHD